MYSAYVYQVSGLDAISVGVSTTYRSYRAQVPQPRNKGRCRSNTHFAVTRLEDLTAGCQQANLAVGRSSYFTQVMQIGTVGPRPKPTMIKPKYRVHPPPAYVVTRRPAI